MSKIFTIGFSGKSPDAFMDVLNAVRVRGFTVVKIWPQYWARGTNITQNLHRQPKF